MTESNSYLPVIAIVGRPNVGKSTLFNYFTNTRAALVANEPGLTRDRQYGLAELDHIKCIVIDTGGVGEGSADGMSELMAKQTEQALNEADVILFMVDARSGLTAADEEIAAKLRKHQQKPVLLLVNKTEGLDKNIALIDFYKLGYASVFAVAAAHGQGIDDCTSHLEQLLKQSVQEKADQLLPEESEQKRIKFAIIGRPNVGKSTLVNRILGEDRVIVYDQPGTTRDSIYIPFDRLSRAYTIIDTAGMRRRARVHEVIEKFSIVKTLQAIEVADVVIILIDARDNITDQDLHLIGKAYEMGKAMVFAVNKWDGLDDHTRSQVKMELDRRLPFLNYVEKFFISALHGTNVGHLLKAVNKAYESAGRKLSTPKLTKILQQAVSEHQPPLVRGRRIKLRYAHPGGHYPPCIVIHGNLVDELPQSYARYLENKFRTELKLVGTPVRIQLKSGTNPYAK